MKLLETFLQSINEETAYQKYFKTKLAKWNIKTPMALKSDDEKKKFWDEVNKDWKSKKEKK